MDTVKNKKPGNVVVPAVKDELVKFRVNETEKNMIDFMASQYGLKRSAYLLMLATLDFKKSEFNSHSK